VQAVISGKKQADEAVRHAQKNADEILRPYNEKIAHVSASKDAPRSMHADQALAGGTAKERAAMPDSWSRRIST
jgi:hypothetical protein